MKRTNYILMIFTLLTTFLIGCAEKCEDFNNEIIEWMPYNETDKILIVKDNWTDTLIVNYSEIYHTDKIGFGVKCVCENSYILNVSSDSLSIDIRFDNSGEVKNSEIVINEEWMNYSESIDKLEINNKEYTDLIIYKNINQTSTSRFKKIIKIQYNG